MKQAKPSISPARTEAANQALSGSSPGCSGQTPAEIERVEAALADEALALDPELPLRRALEFWRGPRLGDAMTAFHLDDLAQVPVRLLSTGQAKRARLARVMANGAPLWLLDEPLNGLDRDGAERLDAAIASQRRAGGAVVAASHHPLSGDWRMMEMGQ